MGKLVNLGSLCIDHVYGVQRLPVAGETVPAREYNVFPGGKGLNQSLAAARAGAAVAHFGCVGVDHEMLTAPLLAEGVDVSGVREVVGVSSGHAVIQVDEAGANSIVIHGGANRSIDASDIDAALDAVQPQDWLLLQNEINDLEHILAEAQRRQVRVAFNVAPIDSNAGQYDLAGLSLLIVNEHEARALADCDEISAAFQRLAERLPTTDIVLTLGEQGLRYTGPSGEGAMDALRVTAIDETAAGDAFIGYFMAGLLAGHNYVDALRRASAAGACAVTQAGAASSIPTPSQVDLLLAAL